jgi:protein TonB
MSIYSKSRLELYAYFNPDELYRLKKLDEKWTKFLWIFLGIAIFLHGLFFVSNIIKNLNLAPKEPPPLSIEIVAPKGGAADTGAVKKPVEMVKPTPEPKPKEKPTPKPSEQAKPLPVPQEIPKTETTPTKSATEKSVSTVDSDKYADYLKNPKPPYPMGPYREGIEGTVWLRVEVLEDGTVGQLQVVQSSGNDELDQSALTTVKTWRFNAAVQGGRAAAQFVRIPITFKLHR